jgi:hypothetical protein
MKIQLLLGFLGMFCSVTQGYASQTIVTFEDVAPGVVADGYAGISGWERSGSVFANEFGEAVGTAYFYGQTGELDFDAGPLIFQGAFYKSYAADSGEPTPSFSLYYQGQLVHQTLDPHVPLELQWLESGYAGLVDKLIIHGGGEGYAIDNLTYTITSVPVPGAMGLFVSGLMGLMFSTRRSRRAA